MPQDPRLCKQGPEVGRRGEQHPRLAAQDQPRDIRNVVAVVKINFSGGGSSRMKGRHSKRKSSNQKSSKLYVKRYKGQGR
jgi:hypothetical protein